jgi:hypothetical protein
MPKSIKLTVTERVYLQHILEGEIVQLAILLKEVGKDEVAKVILKRQKTCREILKKIKE